MGEIPHLKTAVSRFKDKPFEILAVSCDDDRAALANMLKLRKPPGIQTWSKKGPANPNAELYNVQGYPTIILANAEGEAFASTGYREDGPEPYLEHLNDLLEGKKQRDMHLEKALKSEGLDKARHLDEALSLESIIVPDRVKFMKQIVELDADNRAELRDKYQNEIKLVEARKRMQEIEELFKNGKMDEALILINQNLEVTSPADEMYFQLIKMKIFAIFSNDDFDGALELLNKTINRKEFEAVVRQDFAAMKWQMLMRNESDVKAITKALKDAIAIDPDSDYAKWLKEQSDALKESNNK